VSEIRSRFGYPDDGSNWFSRSHPTIPTAFRFQSRRPGVNALERLSASAPFCPGCEPASQHPTDAFSVLRERYNSMNVFRPYRRQQRGWRCSPWTVTRVARATAITTAIFDTDPYRSSIRESNRINGRTG